MDLNLKIEIRSLHMGMVIVTFTSGTFKKKETYELSSQKSWIRLRENFIAMVEAITHIEYDPTDEDETDAVNRSIGRMTDAETEALIRQERGEDLS